jgi:hypothetical protein
MPKSGGHFFELPGRRLDTGIQNSTASWARSIFGSGADVAVSFLSEADVVAKQLFS